MEDKIAFPLNDTDYLADDLRAWHIGRSPGIVNFTGNDFAVSASGGMNVSVSKGAAYLFTGTDNPGGVIFLDNTEESGTFETASSTDRYDYVAIEYNEAENNVSVKYVKGNDTKPTPKRDASTYQLIPAIIRVRANAGSITNADITDTRMDESLCGLCVDMMARIPTEQYNKQFMELLKQLEDALDGNTAGNLLNLINQNKQSIIEVKDDVRSLLDNDLLYVVGTDDPTTDNCPNGYFYFQIEE